MTPDRQCTATAKSTGRRCEQPAIRGGSVCWKHGGASPKVRAAADRRVEAARVEAELAKLVASEPPAANGADVDPLEVLVTRLASEARMAGVADRLIDQLATAPGGVDESGRAREALYGPDHLGDLRAHPLLGIGQGYSDAAARHAKLALDAGIDVRRVAIEERELDVVEAAMVAVLVKRGIDPADVRVELAREFEALDAASTEVTR